MADQLHEIAALRSEYSAQPLREDEVAAEPVAQFSAWLSDAVTAAIHEPNAMVLATTDATGVPSARNVLLKHVDVDGFVFYTNRDSRKGRELVANPRAALVFSWLPIYRQVIVLGDVAPTGDVEDDVYFASRPRGSQLAAWASRQSHPLSSREELEARFDEMRARFEGGDVTRPGFWGGFRLRPVSVEFWQGRRDRLHDRLRYTREAGSWRLERLNP